MSRNKRMQFWGEDEDDDRLVLEIISGEKTATVGSASGYFETDGEFDDGGWEIGDLVDVYDLRQQLRCRIRITEVYKTRFGEIPEKLWKGEACKNAAHFQDVHRACWPNYHLTDEFELIATHFELDEVIKM
jgi:uncharacterized protein YhfF